MAFIITEPCIDIKDGACTQVCPVECIYEGGRMFYIHQEECIHCGVCESICPVDAIRSDEHLSADEAEFVAVNRDFFGADVTGWGSPGGWTAAHTTDLDHPAVAARAGRDIGS
ncbi:ferredoxin family protein [Nitratireductor sp. ZSWI3]|uniref:indolepyruvate ferredoxin oxidoreductase subunit alpha n=1 Tax=Nitratireductor sp. ZSWI3 TaxID=2966359 RepID=UPI00215060C9|nr:ferredoxin family protein [Nitratireductor sp. ZSWI3]MCR4268124.1 ferredoxin family protein [Nitratireductor sp. ZSWI3]